jgi:ERCC4-related helicase
MCSLKGLADSLEHVYTQYVEKLLPKEEEDNVEKILSYSSEKFRALFHWLKAKAEKEDNFKTIVFVERMSTAFYINRLLSALSQKFTFIKSHLEWIEAPMDSKKQVLINLSKTNFQLYYN